MKVASAEPKSRSPLSIVIWQIIMPFAVIALFFLGDDKNASKTFGLILCFTLFFYWQKKVVIGTAISTALASVLVILVIIIAIHSLQYTLIPILLAVIAFIYFGVINGIRAVEEQYPHLNKKFVRLSFTTEFLLLPFLVILIKIFYLLK